MSSVLVSHPHVATVSARLAEGLEAESKLAAYVTGLGGTSAGWSGRALRALSARRPVIRNRIVEAIPPSRLRARPAVELGARLAARVFTRAGWPIGTYDAVFAAHDAAVAWSRWPARIDAIYAYEDGALRTFQRAAREGIARVWDLPTPHYRLTEEIFRAESRRWPDAAVGKPHEEPAWKQRRKDAELRLASKISVASRFTRKSLERTETEAPIVVAPYGFPADEFAPRAQPPGGPFRVLSAGSQDLRKGTPYLLEAWRRADIPDAELHIVGPLRLAKPFLDRYAGLFTHWPPMSRTELRRHYAAADLLVFPTLGDGFGLVIQEAMCTATPVVTTPCGGGPECITDGVDGWIVPPRDIDALVERLREASKDRGRTAEVGRRARARAEAWTWRDAVRTAIADLEL